MRPCRAQPCRPAAGRRDEWCRLPIRSNRGGPSQERRCIDILSASSWLALGSQASCSCLARARGSGSGCDGSSPIFGKNLHDQDALIQAVDRMRSFARFTNRRCFLHLFQFTRDVQARVAGDVLSRANCLERLETSHAKRVPKAPPISRVANAFDRSFRCGRNGHASLFSCASFIASRVTAVGSKEAVGRK